MPKPSVLVFLTFAIIIWAHWPQNLTPGLVLFPLEFPLLPSEYDLIQWQLTWSISPKGEAMFARLPLPEETTVTAPGALPEPWRHWIGLPCSVEVAQSHPCHGSIGAVNLIIMSNSHVLSLGTSLQGSCAEWHVTGWKLETSTRLFERRAGQAPLTSCVLTLLCLPGLRSLWIFMSVSSSSSESSYLLQWFAQSFWAYSLEKIGKKCFTYQTRGSYVFGRKKTNQKKPQTNCKLLEWLWWNITIESMGKRVLHVTDTRFLCVGENIKSTEHQWDYLFIFLIW